MWLKKFIFSGILNCFYHPRFQYFRRLQPYYPNVGLPFMKKILFSSIILFALQFHPLQAQDYHSDLYFFSEISPILPTDQTKYLKNPHLNQNVEWRNRIGLRTFGNLFVGINGTLRTYQQKESVTGNSSVAIYQYHLENTLWGLGPYMTKLFEINDKLYFTASVLANLEQGRGKILVTKEENGANLTNVVLNRSLREITLAFNGELGMAYLINNRMAVHLGLNLLRYERYSTATGRTFVENSIEPGSERNFNTSKRGISTFLERPVFHLGIIGALKR